jgi:hypothetical protein
MNLSSAWFIRALTGIALAVTVSNDFAADVAQPGAAANKAKNLARLNCGAHIERVMPGGRVTSFAARPDSTGAPNALLLDDNTLSCPLTAGDNVFIVTLSHVATLQRLGFINRNGSARGEFEVAVSNYRLGSTDGAWNVVRNRTAFGKESVISLPLTAVEARYVRLTFHVDREGQIAALALYGIPTLEGFARDHVFRANTNFSIGSLKLVTPLEDTLHFNYANQYAQGRIAYVSSSGPDSPSRMIDDDASTSFSFAGNDDHPTMVVELSGRQRLHRVSALSEGVDTSSVQVYLLNDLGSDPGDLSQARLVPSSATQAGDGTIKVDFDPQNARYVALRWNRTRGYHKPIEVAEIGVFGTVAISVLDLTEQPEMFAENSKPGEGSQDASNSLGTLASPPSIGSPSP